MWQILYVDCDEAHPVRCVSPAELALNAGDMCVLKFDEMLICGKVTALTAETAAEAGTMPHVLRRATLQDQSQANENAVFARTAWKRCQEKIAELKLEMRLLKVRYALDRSMVRIIYAAEERVDFRRLVQILAAELHTRIDMRQIGPRSVTAMLGCFGPCGRHTCCSTWLRTFDNISMRLAKQQGVALTPANLNGICGRLKCCLRFENRVLH